MCEISFWMWDSKDKGWSSPINYCRWRLMVGAPKEFGVKFGPVEKTLVNVPSSWLLCGLK